jgi:hypothetical protein
VANINGTEFFQRKADQYGMPASHARFTRDYVFAVNSVLSELGSELDFEEMPDEITGTNGDIDLDSHYTPALFWGVDVYLLTLGHRSGELSLKAAGDRYDYAKRQLLAKRQNDNQRTSEADVTGLGYQE